MSPAINEEAVPSEGIRIQLWVRQTLVSPDYGGAGLIRRLDYQGDLTDLDAMAERLSETGLSTGACRSKAELFAGAARALRSSGPASAFFVPGRIELLGKHTDYAGGSSIVAAVERGFCLIIRASDGPGVDVVDSVSNERVRFEMGPDLSPPIGHWSNYPMTVREILPRREWGLRLLLPGTCRRRQA